MNGYLTRLLFLALVLTGTEAQGQQPASGILRNHVTTLHAEGDTLWVGPYLNVTSNGGRRWLVAEADSLRGTRNTVYSLDVEGPVVAAGLGYSSSLGNTSVSSAGGFLFSENGGRTFAYRPPPLDEPGDTTVTYGMNTVSAAPVLTLQERAPVAIDYAPATNTVWVAEGAGGLRISPDLGRTWQRVVLPPDDRTSLSPDASYDDLALLPERNGTGNKNQYGLSVLVDETGTVWAGTRGGLNRSLPSGAAEPGERAWQRYPQDTTKHPLTGNRIIALAEQPVPGRNPVWAAAWPSSFDPNNPPGAAVTRDGGTTFDSLLTGKRIIDFAFRGQETVYAAGTDALFISEDDGATWRSERAFGTPFPVDRLYAVATTTGAVWAGTSEGLFKSTDAGATWTLFRASVPLSPDAPTEAVPQVETYAYPNPFSPTTDRRVRIRYAAGSGTRAEIQLFDFGMNLVRRLSDTCPGEKPRTCEAFWDGTDRHGLRVASGVYFYTVDTGRRTVKGKILVVQ